MSVITHLSVTDSSSPSAMVTMGLQPLLSSLIGLATIATALFILLAGIQYITSSGNVERLARAKRSCIRAMIGLVIVLSAASITSILSSAQSNGMNDSPVGSPQLIVIEPADTGGGVVEVLIKAITGLFRVIVESAAKPFFEALTFFTRSTVLMRDNPVVVKLWVAVVAIANVLLVVAISLIGFHIMSATALGIEEIDLRSLLPKIISIFLLMNSSLLVIDSIIGISNVMIAAIMTAFAGSSLFLVLQSIATGVSALSLVSLLLMVVFIVLAVMLLVYYVMRIVTLYVGAILSPLVALLLLVPGFKDFALSAIRVYIITIFSLFVQVIMLVLAASLLQAVPSSVGVTNSLMSLIIGIATLLSLLKVQGLMMQMSYVSAGPKALRKLGNEFMNGVSALRTVSRPSSQNVPVVQRRTTP